MMRPVVVGATFRSRLILLGALYFAQGVPWGFLTVAIPLRLAGLGLGPAALGALTAASWLPWTAKPLLGPLADRISFGRFGRRRPFILLAEAGMACSLFALGGIDPVSSLSLFSALVLLHNLFAAAQDVGSDALALEILGPDERGRANGVMSAGKYAGTLLGGPALSWAGSHFGWAVASAVAIALLLLPATLVLLAHEPPRTHGSISILRETWRSFARHPAALAALFALGAGASDSFLWPMTFPLYRQRLGLSDIDVNILVTMGGTVAAIASIFGGLLSDRIGRQRALAFFSIGTALSHTAFAACAGSWRWFPALAAYSIVGSLFSGMLFAATLAFFMDLTSIAIAATQFQIYMSLLNVRSTWAAFVGGRLAERISAPAMFIVGAALEILPLALLPYLAAVRPSGKKSAEQGEVRMPP